MQIFKLKVNRIICTGCNVCVVSCPINFSQLRDKSFLTEKNAVILVKNGVAEAVYVDGREANCDGCGVCVKNCPQNAITMLIETVQ